MSQSFKVGDVVVLKSGGPRMTVAQCADCGLLCMWFQGNEEKLGEYSVVRYGERVQIERFPADALKGG